MVPAGSEAGSGPASEKRREEGERAFAVREHRLRNVGCAGGGPAHRSKVPGGVQLGELERAGAVEQRLEPRLGKEGCPRGNRSDCAGSSG